LAATPQLIMDAPAMSIDIADWLRGLGLEQYAQLFRDNDIDGEILGGMNAEDLKELGISSFGHRRRLLNAITALGGAPATRDVAQSAMSVTSAPVSPPAIDAAERRQLTVMFCDLVGSTPIALLSLEERIDTNSAAGELVFHVFGAIAHFERRLIAERTRDGIAAARVRGKRPGRHPLDPEKIAAALELVKAGLSPTVAARQLGLGRSTVYREVGRAGIAR
jgi:hypothetical protein